MFAKHVIYSLLPAAFMAAVIIMYFSGVPWMQATIAPEINREFGLIENVQNGLLVATLLMSIVSARREMAPLRKAAFAGIAFWSAFLFLEEIDYGLHYWEFISGRPAELDVRNVHNEGFTQDFKTTAYILIGSIFVVLPLLRSKVRFKWLSDFIPSRWVILTVALVVITPEVAHFLDDVGFGAGGALHKNIGEFGETVIYYLLFVYVLEIRSAGRDNVAVERTGTAPA